MPTPLTDADKVLRNDTGKDIVTKLNAIKIAIENGGGGGGGASTVSQLTDVLLSATIPDGDVLVRDNNLTGGKLWKNKTITVELTQAEYNQLVADDEVLPDVDYYITDAPSMQGTSADLSYDGTTKSTYTKIEEVASDVDTEKVANTASYLYKPTVTEPTLSVGTNHNNRTWYYKHGTRVCLSIGLRDLSVGLVNQDIFTLPVGYRPRKPLSQIACGYSFDKISAIMILDSGVVRVAYTQDQGCFAYVEFDAYS